VSTEDNYASVRARALGGPDAVQRRGRGGFMRYVFPGLWLIYLAQAVSGVNKHARGGGAVAGYLIIVAFIVVYLVALPAAWTDNRRRSWALWVLAVVLFAAELPFAHEDATAFCVYIAVLTVAVIGLSHRERLFPLLAALAIATTFGPLVVPSWHAPAQYGNGLAVILVGLAMFGFFSIIRSNAELAAARSEVARLAAENERSRIARDLHDLLGHSLTTITVKAGLARRLAERGDNERAAAEIADVEELTRRSLADVRAAVSGYRDVALVGELANAREVLRAAGVDATLPGAVDVVDTDLHELFGWVVREGVTNVVRHARATAATISLGPNWIEIVDNGRGGPPGAGNGLTGLRERVDAYGGTTEAGGCPQGWRLRVEVPVERDRRPSAVIQPETGSQPDPVSPVISVPAP
jgi:two-component system, NarL family, sensor histidine kinase DesK